MKNGAALSLLLILGCTGGGDGGGYDTVRDGALGIGEAICERAEECGEIAEGDVADCISGFVTEVCDDADCNQAPLGSSSDIGRCISAIRRISCTAENLPGECADVL